MKSATQDSYWPDRLGSRRGGPVRPSTMAWKNLGRAFRLPNGNFGLFGLANTHISVCSVWPIPIFRSVRSGQYPYFGRFGLANTHISVCLVWPIPRFWLVRSGPIPKFRSVQSGQWWPKAVPSGPYPSLSLIGLANTCLGYGWSGQCLSWVAGFILGDLPVNAVNRGELFIFTAFNVILKKTNLRIGVRTSHPMHAYIFLFHCAICTVLLCYFLRI